MLYNPLSHSSFLKNIFIAETKQQCGLNLELSQTTRIHYYHYHLTIIIISSQILLLRLMKFVTILVLC